MLIKPNIIKFLTTGIIAPHGITDIIHAEQNKNIVNLLNVYSCTNSLFLFLDTLHLQYVINFILFFTSVIHFQRDIPVKDTKNKILITSLMLLYFIFLDNTDIFLYLTFIHVPNHYRLSWNFLKKNELFSFFVLITTTLISFYYGNEYFELYKNDFYFDIVKGIITSHVIYEELFIFN